MKPISGKRLVIVAAVVLVVLCVVGAAATRDAPTKKPLRTEGQPLMPTSPPKHQAATSTPEPIAEVSAALLPQELTDAINVAAKTISDWQQILLKLLPQAVIANAQNFKAGALSVFYGPLGFAVEASQGASFWAGRAPCSVGGVLAEAKANALRRFEFSLGSFLVEAILFLLINGVTRRSRLLKRNLARPTHVNWLKLVMLAAIPTGLIDVAAVVASLAAAPATALLPALFVGKLVRPYLNLYVLWAMRWASRVECIAGPLQQAALFLQAWTAEMGTSAARETSTQILVTAAAAAVVIVVLALTYPSEPSVLDEEEDPVEEQ